MNSSMKALGTYVNSLLEREEKAYVSENSLPSVTVNNLTENDIRGLISILEPLGLTFNIKDSVEQDATNFEFADRLPPFTLTFQKPTLTNGIGFLTNRSFADWMRSPSAAGLVYVACATKSFSTESFTVAPWDEGAESHIADSRKSPARLVRSDGTKGAIPQDIRHYLLADQNADNSPWGDSVFKIWCDNASRSLPCCLANDVFPLCNEIEFRGKPRIRLKIEKDDIPVKLSPTGFSNLQAAARWIYDIERESELRHTLLTQEISRLFPPEDGFLNSTEKYLEIALEGAKIAYEFSLQEMSKDALKGLSELRKSVVEETQKIIDSTRQLLLGVAGAAFYALGLIAARMISKVDPWLIDVMAFVGFLYVASLIVVNSRALTQQRNMRNQWRNKLYRYLTNDEYLQLVDLPVQRSERILGTTMWIALIFSILSFSAVIYIKHV